MSVLPPALEDLIEALGSLPGVGSRTAERYAYYNELNVLYKIWRITFDFDSQ